MTSIRSKNSVLARALAIAACCGVSLTAASAMAQTGEPVEPAATPEPAVTAPSDVNTDVAENTMPEPKPAQPVAEPMTPATAEPAAMSVSSEAAKEELSDEKAFEPFVQLQSDFFMFDNADFRELQPADPIAVIDAFDADDRTLKSFTSVRGGFEYEPMDRLEVEISGGYKTVWGGDDRLYFDKAYVEYDIVDGAVELDIAVGRQPFEVGNAESEYFFDDAVDAFVLGAEFGKGGELEILAFDFYSSGARPEDLNFSSGLGVEQRTSFRANGDNNIYRTGAVYSNTELIKGLDFRAFGFYADIGATDGVGSGSDRSFGQSLGNFSDNDYTWVAGTRIGYNLDGEKFDLKLYGEFARSGGIDRKATNLGLFDVSTEGNAFGAVVKPEFKASESFGIRGIAQFYMADGAQYAEDNGVLFNHGFVAMRGNQVGGLIANRVSGWHPNAYVGTGGVYDQPHALERIAGTMVLHAGLGFDIAKELEVDFDFWYYGDTASSNFDGSTITAASELPFGYDEFDLLAQERFGKALGTEINLRLAWRPVEIFELYAQGGIMMPGDYYKIEVDRRVGTGGSSQRVAVGSEDAVSAQAVLIGASLEI